MDFTRKHEPKSVINRLFISFGFALLILAGCTLDTTPASSSSTNETAKSRLVVAWVDAGNLIVWQTGDEFPRRVASGGVVRPYVSPDGAMIAFTRGPNGFPESLWVVDVGGATERQLVGDGTPRTFRNRQSQVGDVAWYDEGILYFNTLNRTALGFEPNDDLYRANARTREVALIRNPSEGGQFVFSPDREWIAMVSSGTYGRQDGRISIIDPLALRDATNLLFFVGVATGSEVSFYPQMQWTPDSQSLLVAIPDADLVYAETDETVPPTRLWQLPIDVPSDRALLGTVRASFFGLPVWSDNGEHLLYLQREPASNEFTIYLASANGDNAKGLLGGQAGTIELPTWIPNTTKFVYTLDNPGVVYRSGVDIDEERLSDEIVFTPQFLNENIYVFATTPAIASDGIQMQWGRVGEASRNIGSAGANIPVFDAVFVGE